MRERGFTTRIRQAVSVSMREKMGIHRFIVSIFIDIQYTFQTIFLRIKAGDETNIHDIM